MGIIRTLHLTDLLSYYRMLPCGRHSNRYDVEAYRVSKEI